MNPSSPLNSGRSSPSSGSNFRSRPVRNNHNRQGNNNNNGIGGRTRFGRLGPNFRSDQQEENQGLLSSSQDTDPHGEVDGDGATLNSFDERGGFTDRTFQRDTLDGDGNQDWNSPEGSMRRNSRDRIGKRNKGWGNTFRLGGKSNQGDKSRTVGFEDNGELIGIGGLQTMYASRFAFQGPELLLLHDLRRSRPDLIPFSLFFNL